MKTTFRKYFGSLMAVLVLISSMGFGVVEHRCDIRGKSVRWVFSENKSCAKNFRKTFTQSNSKQNSIQRKSCCNGEVSYFKNIETSAKPSVNNLKFQKISDDFSVTTFHYPFLELPIFGYFQAPILRLKTFSSLFHGRRTLSFVQTFLI